MKSRLAPPKKTRQVMAIIYSIYNVYVQLCSLIYLPILTRDARVHVASDAGPFSHALMAALKP